MKKKQKKYAPRVLLRRPSARRCVIVVAFFVDPFNCRNVRTLVPKQIT